MTVGSFIMTFLIMACFWVVFSGKFDGFHLSLGFVSCLIVSFWGHDLLFPYDLKPDWICCWLRFIGYIPWLLYQILLANLYVFHLSLHPRMMERINPQIIEGESRLQGDIARTTFANSITLTPGTITVNVTARGKFAVHCINAKAGRSLPGVMEAKIAKVFKE